MRATHVIVKSDIFHTATVLFNWKWSFSFFSFFCLFFFLFFKRHLSPETSSFPLLFHSVFVELRVCALPTLDSFLMKHKTCFVGCLCACVPFSGLLVFMRICCQTKTKRAVKLACMQIYLCIFSYHMLSANPLIKYQTSAD